MEAARSNGSTRRALALLVVVAVALPAMARVQRDRAQPALASATGVGAAAPRRRGRRGRGDDPESDDLQERLRSATARADAAEEAAKASADKLREVTSRLEAVEGRSADERVAALREELRRSEAERALLRSGRPETLQEAEVRGLRQELREAQALARAAEAASGGNGDLAEIKEQLVDAANQVDEAIERAKVAEGREDAAEDRVRAAGELVTAADRRIDGLEARLQELAGAGVTVAAGVEVDELRRELAASRARAEESERLAAEAEERLAATGSTDGRAEEILGSLEERVVAAEARAAEAEARVAAFQDELEGEGSSYRHRLGMTAAGRKLAAPAAVEVQDDPQLDLRVALAKSLRAPLRRASGLTLTLQGAIESSEGRAALRQLSSSLRRLDQVAADLSDVQRLVDGTVPISVRRTDLAALLATTIDEASNLEDRLVRLDAHEVTERVDPVRVRQIVEGMLDAAKERTRNGAAIVVRVREGEAGPVVTVEDDSRVPATIGPELTLAVRLAELLGTELTVDGSTYRLPLPKGEAPG